MGFNRKAVMSGVAVGAILMWSPARAQSSQQNYDISPQPLKYALRSVTRQAGYDLLASSDALRGKSAPALHGLYSVDAAITALLEGSGLNAEIKDRTVYIRGRATPSDAPMNSPADSGEILVTGSRIEGAIRTSPMISVSERNMRDAGQTSLGDVVRSLPQNFSGGQNPGVSAAGQGTGNENINSSSTINLRGIGGDTTLTLVNGHRVAYDGANQSVNIDAIPIDALDRLEIVADGSSAIYGSDAVGGVANLILKRDFEGLTASARVAGATDGGDVQQQYELTTGRKWSNGGFMVAGDVTRSTAIYASQRSYAKTLDGSTTLVPWIHRASAVLAGHQSLGETFSFELDGSYSRLTSAFQSPSDVDASYLVNGDKTRSRETSFAATPKLSARLGAGWTASLSGTYAFDHTLGRTATYEDGAPASNVRYGYDNSVRIVEASAQGPVLTLPAGPIKLALGGGYRSSRLKLDTTPLLVDGSVGHQTSNSERNSYYGFAELNVPVIAPDQNIPAVYRLAINGAVRYEDYPSMASLATPKFGALYAPTADVDFKASWGKSFKTPTLYQQHEVQFATLLPANYAGGSASSTILFRTGGNPDLKPEKATGWSATIDAHPRVLPGLNFEVSAFHINYRNRIVMPISTIAGSLTNPVYQPFLTIDPNVADLTDAIGSALSFGNYTDGPYDPSAVAAIIDDRVHNVARQIIHGVDISGKYEFDFGNWGRLTATAAATYLHSRRQLEPGTSAVTLAGTVFNPPHWRGRTGLSWVREGLTVGSYVTYLGGVDDNRTDPFYHVRGMAPVDLVISYALTSDRAALNGLTFQLSISNIQNVKPAILRNEDAYDPTYDTTNYPAIGRLVGASVSKHF